MQGTHHQAWLQCRNCLGQSILKQPPTPALMVLDKTNYSVQVASKALASELGVQGAPNWRRHLRAGQPLWHRGQEFRGLAKTRFPKWMASLVPPSTSLFSYATEAHLALFLFVWRGALTSAQSQ